MVAWKLKLFKSWRRRRAARHRRLARIAQYGAEEHNREGESQQALEACAKAIYHAKRAEERAERDS